SILKDAAATAIYGSRAANGVVVVKTVAPQEGQLRVSYNFEGTFTWPDLSDYNLLNGKEKLALEKAAGLYEAPKEDLNAQILLDRGYNRKKQLIAEGVNTDWLAQPLDELAFSQKHSLYIEGGSRSLRFGIDGKYEIIKGVMKESGRNRFSLGTNMMYNKNDKLLFRNYLSIDYMDAENSPYGSFDKYVAMNPYLPVRDENGDILKIVDKFSKNYTWGDVKNPLYDATLNNVDDENYVEVSDNLDLEWRIIPSLKVKAQLTVNHKTERMDQFISPKSTQYDKDYRYEDEIVKGYYSQEHRKTYGYNGNFILSYSGHFGGHFVNAVLGANVMETSFDRTSVSAEGFPNENIDHISLAKRYAKDTSPGGNEEKSRLFGGFLSLNYTYQNKYLLDFSCRLDGSSQFGSEEKTAPFGSVGIGWNIHKERFLENINWLDLLKIRATYGTIGKANFAPYQALSTYKYNMDKWYSQVVSATLKGYGNKDLKWETTQTYDFGFELSLWKGVFSLNAAYYIKETDNLLTDFTTPPSTGFSSYKSNLGKVENRGFELAVRAYVLRKDDVSVNLFANASRNQNRIKEISNSLRERNQLMDQIQSQSHNATTPFLRYEEGGSMTSIFAMKSLGIDPATGNELYLNKKGETTYLWQPSQQIAVGDTEPAMEGYFGTNVDYKGWNLYTSFHYRMGGQIYNQTLIDRVENADPKQNADRRVLIDRWQKPGDVTFFKNVADFSQTKISSRFVQDYNFLSLSSVSLSYDLKKDWVKAICFENIRLMCTINDVFRCSTVEQERGIAYPFARSMKFSIQARF
ncbi:MAG: SusC/RagA family TonB-linked outer membrane protein, partial [Odoribacter sp.]